MKINYGVFLSGILIVGHLYVCLTGLNSGNSQHASLHWRLLASLLLIVYTAATGLSSSKHWSIKKWSIAPYPGNFVYWIGGTLVMIVASGVYLYYYVILSNSYFTPEKQFPVWAMVLIAILSFLVHFPNLFTIRKIYP
jgi:hypothetical protein